MSAVTANGPDLDVDLRVLFLSILRNWKRIIVFALVLTALAALYTMVTSPKYKAETRILIETRESAYTRTDRSPEDGRTLLDEEGVTSQVQVITSTELLRQVAEQLKLEGNPEFDEAASLGILDRVMILAGLRSDPSAIPAGERVLDAMRERLNVYRVEKSRVIVIEFSSEDARLAADVPNAIADAYIGINQAAKLDVNTDATRWLEPEIDDLRTRVREAEQKVAEYRANAGLLVGQNNSTLASQQLSEFSTELSRVRATRTSAEARAASIRAALAGGASLDAMPEVLSSALIQRLRERQVQLRSEIADLSITLLDNHPRIKSLRAQLSDLDQQIRGEAEKVLSGLQNEARSAKARETEIEAELNRLKAQSAQAGEDEVELRALEREATAERELLESYLTRYREAASRNERNYLPADARIFSRAVQPGEPYFPKKVPIIAAALTVALLLGVLATLVAELFSGRAMRPVTRLVPELQPVATPVAEAEPAVVPQAAATPEPAAFGGVTATAAADDLIAAGSTRAVFVSPEGDEAAASAVIAARAVADTGLRAILLDLTQTGAASRPMTEGAPLAGVTDLLCATAAFQDVIHHDLYSECHIMPIGTASQARAMRAIERLPMILDALSAAYDLVLIECGPAAPAALERLVGDGADVLLSVIDPADPAVLASAEALVDGGFGDIVLVTPATGRAPQPPARARSAA